jgi:hypothetical protein
VPDGIERAEPTIAPSRHRLTAELAKSRFHHIYITGRESRADSGNHDWDSFYVLIKRMSSHFSYFVKPCPHDQ